MLPIILAAVAVAGTIAGGVSQASSSKKQSDMLRSQMNELNSWYTRNRSEDLLDNSSIKNTVREFHNIEQTNNEELANKVSSNSITAEQQVAMSSANNLKWGNSIADVAAKDSEHKQNIEIDYRNRANEIYDNIGSANLSKTGTVNNVASGLYDAMMILTSNF